jgi:hypothetical protein
MLGRITTWISYAAVFFALGAWLGPQPDKMERMAGQGWAFTQSSWHMVQGWWSGHGSLHWPESTAPQAAPQDAQQGAAQSALQSTPQDQAAQGEVTPAAPAATAPVPVQQPVLNSAAQSASQPATPPATPPAATAEVAAPAVAKPAAVTEQDSQDNQAALAAARAAYAVGDVRGALDAYRAVLAKTPADVTALGEMGNVLFATGQLQDAATAFHAAAIALAASGHKAEAMALGPLSGVATLPLPMTSCRRPGTDHGRGQSHARGWRR